MKDGYIERERGFGTQDFEGNTELRRSAFSRAESAVVPFEVRKGMEGEHTPETDLTRCHQVLEEVDKFEKFILEIGQMLFSGSPESRHTRCGLCGMI